MASKLCLSLQVFSLSGFVSSYMTIEEYACKYDP